MQKDVKLPVEEVIEIAEKLWMARLPLMTKIKISEIVEGLPRTRQTRKKRAGYSPQTLAQALRDKFYLRLTPAKFARLTSIFDASGDYVIFRKTAKAIVGLRETFWMLE